MCICVCVHVAHLSVCVCVCVCACACVCVCACKVKGGMTKCAVNSSWSHVWNVHVIFVFIACPIS